MTPEEAIKLLRDANTSRGQRIQATKILCDAYEELASQSGQEIRELAEELDTERECRELLEAQSARLSEALHKMSGELIAAANYCARAAKEG